MALKSCAPLNLTTSVPGLNPLPVMVMPLGSLDAPQTTDPVAGLLGREASGLSHRQEFEADAYAAQVLRTLGRPPQDAFAIFTQTGVQRDTATHPGTRKRLASLRAAQGSAGSGSDAE